MRLSNLSLGTLARRVVLLPLPGREPVEVDVRPLTTTEEVEALGQAHSIARLKGLENPKAGEALYDLCLMACVLVRGAVDHESPTTAPVTFFDSVEQVMSLDRDRVVYLYEAQTAWQDQCSPRQLTLTPEQYIGFVMHLASSDGEGDLGDPFSSYARSTLVSCMRSMARQLVLSHGHRWLTGSDSAPSDASDSSPSAPRPDPEPTP